MTKKLLLPTRIQRMRIRREHVSHPEKSAVHAKDPKLDGVDIFSSQAHPTSYNGGYEEQPMVDRFGDTLQLQPPFMGYSSNRYPPVPAQQTEVLNGHAPELSDQPTSFGLSGPQPLLPQQSTLQPQPTGFQPTGFPTSFPTSFDLSGPQPLLPQQSTLQPQPTGFQPTGFPASFPTRFVNLTPAGNGTSVQDHNQHCEATENGARLEKWIEDQRALEQEWLAQRHREAAVFESNTKQEQYPSPPTLPPRPKNPELLVQAHEPTSKSDLLPRLICEVASAANTHGAAAAEEPSNPCTSNESNGTARQIPEPRLSVDDVGTSEGKSHARPLGPDVDVDVDVDQRGIALLLDDLGPRGSHQANFGVPTKCSRPCDVCTIYYGAQTGPTDQSTRKAAPPPVPPKHKGFQSESNEGAGRSLSPTNPYHSLNEVVRLATTAPSTRVYTSNCGNFKAEADLLDWKDGKVWLRKANGVKVAVPLSRFSGQDVEYVVTEMMRRIDEGRMATTDVGDLATDKCETKNPRGIEAGFQVELEGAYAVAT